MQWLLIQTWFLSHPQQGERPGRTWQSKTSTGDKRRYTHEICVYTYTHIYSCILVIEECSLPHQRLLTHSFRSRKKICDRLKVVSNCPLSSIPAATQACTLVSCWPSKFEHLKCFLLSHVCPVTNWLLAVAVCAPFSRVWQGLLLAATVIIFTRRKKIFYW